jgi:hypothetical protein
MDRKSMAVIAAVVLTAAGALAVKAAVDRQRPQGSDEEQLQQLLIAGESAAERGDAGGIYRLISDRYEDSLGMKDTQMRFQIGRYLRERRNLEITIPSDSVRIEVAPDGRTARVAFRVNAGFSLEGGAATNETTIQLTAAKEPVHYYGIFPGEEWKVTSAEGYASLD